MILLGYFYQNLGQFPAQNNLQSYSLEILGSQGCDTSLYVRGFDCDATKNSGRCLQRKWLFPH